ncbi:hypothetical protein AB0E63_29280 [Kribbella sp. NPDC026596]|uniref:hypothetical protein n=1 Tax=Kribbella sp. NPDC026596 TaxID=3155122 RepID=UPI0033F50756
MSIAESYEILPPSREGRVPFSAGETWYRITGDLGSGVWGSRGAAFASIEDDPTVYHTMNGPSEFHVVGSLKDWTIVDRLPRIAVPTLVVSGAYDEAQPVCVAPYAELIPDARWEVFAESSHLPNVEEPERYGAVVESFLRGD